jgi:tetratricopeptide (TPR) repeat protein
MPDVLLFLLLFAVGVYTALKLGSNRFTGRANPFWLLVAGVVLLGLCVFPYVVVGKSPTPGGGAGTRHNFLVGYPVAMIIVASIRILFSTANQAISRTGFALFMLLMVAFGVSLNQSYIEWFSRSIYSASVQENLANMPEASDFSLYWVETGPLQLSPHRLNFAEWGSMFKEVWGGETRLIIEQRMYTLEEFLAVVEANPLWSLNGQRVVSDFDPGGCQALLMTQIGHVSYQHASGSNSRSELILRYLYHKFVQGPEATDQFLLDLTDVWVEPIAAPEATNCTTTAPERQQQTIAIYNEILEFKPRWAEAYYRRGLAYLALAQPEQAQADLTQAIELRLNFAPAYYERGMAYMMQGDEASARADYQRVLDLSSDESLIRQAEEQLVQRVPTSGARGDMP